jgi:enoyl-CoA hydratase
MNTMNKAIDYQKNDHIAFITFIQHEANSQSNLLTSGEFKQICDEVKQDNEVYIVVLTGMDNFFHKEGKDIDNQPQNTMTNEIASITKPVIAAINGDALGQGLELTLACDIRVASDKARFGLPQIADGKIPSDGGTQRLPRLIGRGQALELILTGNIIDAQEALDIGLIHKCVPSDALATEVERIANSMANKGIFALKYAKEAVIKGMDLTLEQGLRLEADLYMLLHTSHDRTEGIKAFQQKRHPNFKGE